jgi:diguanylate cyclase (GGDEF)-like protein
MADLVPFSDFSSAAAAMLSFLQSRLAFDLWMVTRVEGESWIVLQSKDASYGVVPGQTFRWADSFCSRMVRGEGPRFVPSVQEYPVYRDAPLAACVPIGAYIGVPLYRSDGRLFGTLCAIHPEAKPAAIKTELPMVELFAQFLSSLLEADLRQADQLRRNERSQAEGMRDVLTGLYNRSAWEMLLEREEERCRQFGHPACVIAVDLVHMNRLNRTEGYSAGDDTLRRVGQALRTVTLTTHIAARLSGDDFCVLGIDCGPASAECLQHRIESAFREARISATVDRAMRDSTRGLVAAWRDADSRVQEKKRQYQEDTVVCQV